MTTNVEANRQRFLSALYAEDPARQCRGQMFASSPFGESRCCAEGVAVKVFLGIDNAHDYHAFQDTRGDAYAEINELLGLDDWQEISNLNDLESLSFEQIADTLAVKWGLA